MVYLFLWLILSAVIGFVATAKNRSFLGYALLSIVISPLLTLIVLLVLPPVEVKTEVKVGVKVGNYTRKVFDDEFESEWNTLSKYDSELQVILEKIMNNVDDKEKRAKVFDELKSLYKIKKNVEDLGPAVNKIIENV